MVKGIVLLIAVSCCLSTAQELPTKNSPFNLVGPIFIFSTSQDRYLKTTLLKSAACAFVEEWYRKSDPKLPGNYFMPPGGADSVSLTVEEQAEIRDFLKQNINEKYYDEFVIANIKGYQYSFPKKGISRREYYLNYACGDTVFAISGWLGKFLCFYKLIPGDFRYYAEDLQVEVSMISPSYKKAKRDSFSRREDEFNYLLEYIDKKNKMRIRSYLFDVQYLYGVPGDSAKTYNLIEITKFIDPEVMP